MSVLLSIDQSTQSTKGLVWGTDGKLLSRADAPHKQIVNNAGWVSHDLNEIWMNVKQAASLALIKAGVQTSDVAVIGISNQRETACCWDAATGEPLCDAVVWQCARAAAITNRLEQEGMESKIRRKTGLRLSPFFSAPKFTWMATNIPKVCVAVQKGTARFGTIDSYLLYRMTNGTYKTDFSNASRTGLLNLDTLTWDAELLAAYGLSELLLPEIEMSDSLFGYTTLDDLLPHPVPIHSILGDSHAALYAHHCVEPYMGKATYGTGSSVMLNAGHKRPDASGGVVASLAWGMKDELTYCLEGNINYTGAVITWLCEEMGILDSPAESGAIAESLSGNGGVYLVPAFSGLGSPHFNSQARAAIVGMSRSTKREHVIRAAEECIAYQIYDVVREMEDAIKRPISSLCIDGGPTCDDFLTQFQSDILNVPLQKSHVREFSGAGVAWCAAIACGIIDENELFTKNQSIVIQPKMDSILRNKNIEGWHRAIGMIANA